MKILGISAHYHDSAAALVVDGVPVCAVQEERLSRRKHDAAFPLAAIEWCLGEAGLEPDDLDAVVFYEKPMLKLERILVSALRAFPRSWRSFPHAMRSTLGEKAWVKGIIASRLGVPGKKILFTEHHQSHAAAAFLSAPTREAAILTADGVGEWATLSEGRGVKREDGTCAIELVRELRFPHSLGMLYSAFTAFLGFEVNEGEYKVMGLATYGRPRFEEQVRAMIRRTDDGAFELDLGWFDFHASSARSYSSRFVDVFGPPRASHEPIDPATPEGARWADLAASVQKVLEDVLVDRARRSLPRRRGRAERLRQRADPARVRVRARPRASRPGRRGLRARSGALRGPDPLRTTGSAGAGPRFLGLRRRSARARAAGARGRAAARVRVRRRRPARRRRRRARGRPHRRVA